MNLSLRKRVGASFLFANAVILILCFTVFYFLHSLNKEIESITVQSNKVNLLTEEIWISTSAILNYERKILSRQINEDLVDNFINLCDGFHSQLESLESLYKDAEIKKIVSKMQSYVESLKVILSKGALFSRGGSAGIATISELSKKILEAFSQFQDLRYQQLSQKDRQAPTIISETKRVMMIVLIIAFMGTIIIGLVVPGKIALPFKKIKDAIRELQECNFDVSIYYNQDDEIGEIAREMNKMIHSFKVFEELRTDRVSVENRKFDALANLVKKPVLVANAEGKLIYMNNLLYSLLQVQSEDVIGKEMTDTVIPGTIVESYELAIKRRSKIENTEVLIPKKKEEGAEEEASESEEEVEAAFQGYANVIPIRGKDSSLDYYLMVLSTEVFT